MKVNLKFDLIGLLLASFLLGSLAHGAVCENAAKPCIEKVMLPKVRVYDATLNEQAALKKKDFKKVLPLATEGWKTIDGVKLLKIKHPVSGKTVFVEDGAFKLLPKKKIDCSKALASTLGTDKESTAGVSVGFGDACKD